MLPRLPSQRGQEDYRPRRAGPEHDLLYRTLQNHLEDFLSHAEQRGQFIPAFVEQELRAYLTCGIAEHGFTWLWCEACERSLVLPFSCKGRGFCPSCGGRRMNQLAANLVDRVIPHVPVRHWVLSFPLKVRFLLARRPALRNEVMAAFFDVVLGWLSGRVANQGHPGGQGGGVAVWQLVGSSLACNPHIHAIVLDGAYTTAGDDELPVFHQAQRPTRRIMGRLVREVRARVESILDEHGLLEHVDLDEEDGQLAMQLASVQGHDAERVRTSPSAPPRERAGLWGWDEYFDLHAGSFISSADRSALERLARYIARPPLSLDRLSELPDGRLCLRLKRVWDDGTSCFVFSPQQLIARLAGAVPQPKCHLPHYFGVLAPHASLRRHVVPDPGPEPKPAVELPGIPPTPRRSRSSWLPWAELMSRTWGVDPLRCLCGASMTVRAVVRTSASAVDLLERVLDLPVRLDLLQPTRQAAATEFFW